VSEIEMNERDRLNQLLCAYVLGEADEAERAEIEAALVKDPALRDERTRLEATIGLVKSSMGKDETLSYQAASEVTRAAAQIAQPWPAASRRAPWRQSTSLRIAASLVALIGGGYLGWKLFVKPDRVETLMASAPKEESERSLGYEKKLKGLGYLGQGSMPAPATETAKRESDASGLDSKQNLAEGSTLERSESKNDERLDVQLRKANEDALAARAVGLKDQVGAIDGATPPDVVYAVRGGGQTEGTSLVDLNGFGHGNGSPRFDDRLAGSPPAVDQPTESSGSDEYYLGKGKEAEAKPGVFGARGFGQPTAPPATPRGLTPGSPSGSPLESSGYTSSLSKVRAGKAHHGSGAGSGSPTSPGPAIAGAPGPSGPTTPGATTPGSPSAAKATTGTGGQVTLNGVGRNNLLTPGDPFGLRDGDSKEGADGNFDWEVEAGDLFVLDTGAASEEQTPFEQVDRFKEGKLDNARDERAQRQRRILTPEERQARIEEIIVSCRRLPNEKPRDMFFRFWGDNPYEWTANDRQSTFSMDVDTASYTLARKYLVANHLPEKAQIRTEEFVNYFKPDVAPPTKGTFAIVTELAPSRFSNPAENKWMLRVAVRGQEVQKNERAPLALTFVIDVSGSMKEEHRLELVKHALRQLVGQLDARDSIALVAFSNDTRLVLPMTSAAKRDLIESAIDPLQPDGSTNTEAGLRMGYEQALGALTLNATNRVVLLTDGVANVGITDPNALVQTVERQRKAGIYLNTIGVGMDNHNDNLLEQLADKGDGLCNYVDDAAEVKHALVDNFLQALVPIARDAKVQVEFDPAQVESYRLLGYENRAIADQDFRNDKVDAGEINSGHQITAMYEIVRVGNLAVQDAPLAKVHVRFKPAYKNGIAQPGSDEASEISKPVLAREAAGRFEATSFGYRRAVLAAQFAEFLRRSVHARGDSLDQLIADLLKLSSDRTGDAEVAELADMVVKSKGLLEAEFARRGELDSCVYQLRETRWQREQREMAKLDADREILRAMDEQIALQEARLRALLEQRLK